VENLVKSNFPVSAFIALLNVVFNSAAALVAPSISSLILFPAGILVVVLKAFNYL
jgi:hypothetical protein